MNTINTAMRNAFENVQVKKMEPKRAYLMGATATVILNCLRTKSGKVAMGRGWSLNARYKTRQALQAQGIPV